MRLKIYVTLRAKRTGKPGYYLIVSGPDAQPCEIPFCDADGQRIEDPLLARSELARLRGLIKRGLNPFLKKKLVSEWLEEFLQAEASWKAPATVENERDLLPNFVTYLLANHPSIHSPHQVTPAVIEDYMNFRQGSFKKIPCSAKVNATARTHSTQKVSAKSVNLERAYLALFFDFVKNRLPLQESRAFENPVRKVKPRKTIQRARQPISEQSLWQVIDYFENPRKVRGKLVPANGHLYALALHLAVETGLRPAEVAALRWVDLELDKQLLWVLSSEVHTVKNKTDRPIPLTAHIVEGLKRLYTGQNEHDYVFNIGSGETFQNAFRLAVQKACKALGLPSISPYQLRHTFATRALDSGAPIQQVAAVLGHRKITTTQIYSHSSDRGRRATVDSAALVRKGAE